MRVNLDRQDLVNLVKSIQPSYENLEYFKPYGYYIGGFDDKFIWDTTILLTKSDELLYSFYEKLKYQYNESSR